MCIFLSQVLILPFHEIGHLVANSNLTGVGPQASLWEKKKKGGIGRIKQVYLKFVALKEKFSRSVVTGE